MRYVGEPIKIRLFRGMPGSERKAPLHKRLICKVFDHTWNFEELWQTVDYEERMRNVYCRTCRKYLHP